MAGWIAILSGFFLAWWMGVFAGVFAETWCVNVVFLWSSCGEMCGKDGRLTPRFSLSKNRTPFPSLFSGLMQWLARD
jgi:hypothetical protein